MTQVGHLLTGAAIGALCLPAEATPRRKSKHLAVFMLLANMPDIPLPYWSHDRYDISHSLWSNLLLMVLLGGLLAPFARGRAQLRLWFRNPTVPLLGGVAWLSHLLLDTFYNHGLGVAVFWPLSDWRLALPIPWLSVLRLPLWGLRAYNARVFLVELVSFLPLLLGVLWLRRLPLRPRFVGRPSRLSPVFVRRRG